MILSSLAAYAICYRVLRVTIFTGPEAEMTLTVVPLKQYTLSTLYKAHGYATCNIKVYTCHVRSSHKERSELRKHQ